MMPQNNETMDEIIDSIVKEIKQKLFVMVEASGRHVHLSRHAVEQLFGPGYQLTYRKDLSQPGQFACKERVSITGTKGTIANVIVLGPERSHTQAEVSMTDALTLGVKAPVRLSGDIDHTPGIKITNPLNGNFIEIKEGLIVAKRHIHITPEDAAKFGVTNGQMIKIKVFGNRPVIFEDVDVRVSKDFSTAVHIDYDEANACGFVAGTKGIIVG